MVIASEAKPFGPSLRYLVQDSGNNCPILDINPALVGIAYFCQVISGALFWYICLKDDPLLLQVIYVFFAIP